MKVFKLGFYECSDEGTLPEYPMSSELKAQYTFEDMSTWVPILWQCCKFLEATGYAGITEKIIIKDPFGMHDGGLFETTYDDEFDFDDEEEEEEEEGIIGIAKPGTPEHEEAMKELKGYFDSLSDEEKNDLKKQGYN